jgi:hypothetical protein
MKYETQERYKSKGDMQAAGEYASYAHIQVAKEDVASTGVKRHLPTSVL